MSPSLTLDLFKSWNDVVSLHVRFRVLHQRNKRVGFNHSDIEEEVSR